METDTRISNIQIREIIRNLSQTKHTADKLAADVAALLMAYNGREDLTVRMSVLSESLINYQSAAQRVQ
jgi:hypothetical protein